MAGAEPVRSAGPAASLSAGSANPAVPEPAELSWKIDDLARETGITVDTIRFYQREGLLPEATRQGRSISYGAAHLRALNRIKDLQAKHFSLRAIKSLAEEGRLGLVEVLFSPLPAGPSVPSVAPAAGVAPEIDPGLVDDLRRAGLVNSTGASGTCGTDELAAVEAAQNLVALGMPRPIVLLLVELYVKKFSELEKELIDAIAGQYRTSLEDELEALASQDPDVLASVLPLAEVIFHYVQKRSMERVVQEAIESLAED